MKTVQEIYDAYRIMPSLQLHMLRVAAVGKLVCDDFSSGGRKSVDEKTVITACLFHDMGNIIKSDLTRFPEFSQPQGVEYWQDVKKEFIKKYGDDAHAANVAITRDAGLPESAIALIDGIGFSKLEKIFNGDSFDIKICEYADTRVGPRGVLPIDERLGEAKKRYDARQKRKDYYESSENFERLSQAAYNLEQQIFALVSIAPGDINDATVNPLVEPLRTHAVS